MSKTKEIKAPKWEIKNRSYKLAGPHAPLTFTLQSKHSSRYPLLWFDDETGEQRELRYATNQNSPFVDEQKGECTLGHIIFENGILTVPKQKVNLQKLLSLYHPKKGFRYNEVMPAKQAEDQLDQMDYQLDAMNAAKNLEIDHAEAILRVEKGSDVATMSSKEIKRDVMLMAKQNPANFLAIASDENVGLRNIGIKATQQGIIKLSADQRTFTYGETDRKLMSVPFDEHPYSALAAWFKTDEGMEVFMNLEKRLK